MKTELKLRRRIRLTASWTVLGIAMAFSGHAAAQTTPSAGDQEAAAPSADDAVDSQDNDAIVVVGSRASQQSANARKKNAKTATDSIVADDIGSFPDRNVNEAISRIPGVALSRNDFGEGDGVAVRGNGMDLTRVELDGVSVQSTTNLATGSAPRSADLRELPAELVKSIDVVKGSTADMTEGSLGGGILIKTRTGLDFKRPYISLRAGAGQNSLGRDWTPDFNGVATHKFFGDRLGVIVSGSYSKLQNNAHEAQSTISGAQDYSHFFDFDNSPEKTFSYIPSTVGTDAADVPFANSTAPDGTTLTPRELVTLSAGATSKAQCLTIFPHASATASTAIRNQRIIEQQTCLNQWNDATPSLIRNFMNTQTDERMAFDARMDFRVTDQLTIYAKGTIANRQVHDQNRSRNQLTGLNNTIYLQNLTGTFTDTTTGYPRIRSVATTAPAGYYLYDGLTVFNNNATIGQVINVVPSSVVVDANHNVTKMTLTNNIVTIDQIENHIDTKTKYAQGGAEFRGDRLDIDLFGGYTRATSARGDMRTSRQYAYGEATIQLQPNGLYDVQVPANYNDGNPANYVQLSAPACITGTPPNCTAQNAVTASFTAPASPAYTQAQLPLVTPSFGVAYTPAAGISTEKLAKLDLTYRTEDMLPFITQLKVGAMYRNQAIQRWGNGGYTVSSAIGTFGQPGYVPPVVVPTAIVRGTLRACQPTATSTVSCNYGFVPAYNPSNIRSGVDTLTPQQLQDLFTATLDPADSAYFGDYPNRGNLPAAWSGIRTDKLYEALGASQFINDDCLKFCVGSDGKLYEQPITRTNETIKNLYAMFDFEQRLPLGVLFNGNVGVRGVFAKTQGSGQLTLVAIKTTSAYDPLNRTAPAGFTTQTFIQNTTLNGSTTDWLPSFNANLWGFNQQVVLRFYGGKTVARPPIANLLAAGNCTVDQRDIVDLGDDAGFNCSGRVGNPNLKPYTAWNYNLSLEWYPNADTLFSVAYGKLDVKIGSPISVSTTAQPFAGSDIIDPVTNTPLSEFEFTYPTYANGPGYKRNIFEFSAKTAFTFLPWFFKHTGADANVSLLASSVTTGVRDPKSGDLLPPPNESKYYINASLWYDDGKLNLRVAYQKRSERFVSISSDINYPGEGYPIISFRNPGYAPGIARYVDGSTFIDAKASYNITRNFQVYLEGRNLRREAQTNSINEKVEPFADGTPKTLRVAYGGRRIMGGVRIQFGN